MRDGEDNAKAFFRQGQAYMALNDIDAAVASLKKALDLEPNDGGIKKELASARKKVNKLSAVLSLFLNAIWSFFLLQKVITCCLVCSLLISHMCGLRVSVCVISGFLLRTYKAARSLERALFLPLRRQIRKALILLSFLMMVQFFGYTLCTGRRLSLLLYMLRLNRLVYTMDILISNACFLFVIPSM
ncbi:hypothetical protein NC651_013484 [Populus alba x Populus x berolinensis]|nr:hypothetical protein NC651_013484 [Populus alba x Populus x berolinensis]